MIAWLRRRLQSWMRPRQAESLPVRLRRNRIYVLPTATGLFFALLLGTMGLGALNFNNNPGLLLALLLAGAAQASLIAAHMQLSGVVWMRWRRTRYRPGNRCGCAFRWARATSACVAACVSPTATPTCTRRSTTMAAPSNCRSRPGAAA